MKNLLFILIFNYFICSCPAEYFFSGPLNTFLSFFLINDPTQYEQVSTESNAGDLEPERLHDPLDLLVVRLDGKLMGTIGNPLLYEQYIQSTEFVDLLFACPKKDAKQTEPGGKNGKDSTISDKKKTATQTKTEKKTAQNIETSTKTLVIEENLISVVTRHIQKAKELAEIGEKITIAPDSEIENTNISNLNQEKVKERETGVELTKMELDLNQNNDQKHDEIDNQNPIQAEQSILTQDEITRSPQEGNENIKLPLKKKFRREESLKHTAAEKDISMKLKNKEESVDKPRENQEVDGSGQNKMEIDQTSVQKTDEVNSKENKTPILTAETKNLWIRALDEVKNFKCQKPINAHLFEYPTNSIYKFYLGGFEIFMENHSDLDLPEFTKLPNEKYKWFWSFTIVMSKSNQSTICVYQEAQYNKDTYSSHINENFQDHDLGKEMMFPGLDISGLYEIKNQVEVFEKLFKNGKIREQYFDPHQNNVLERVHLAPLNTFVSPLVRQTAKTYGNVAPMWSSIRNGAWQKIEDYINILSYVLIDLIVITGTYGTLKLGEQNIYLDDNHKVPVPLAFWKMVLYGSETDNFRGMLIITSNNPYESIGNVICKQDTCKQFGWGYIQEDYIPNGRTTCCEFQSKILKDLPILKGAQPSQVLDLNELSPIVKDIWKYNLSGEETTQEEREAILDMLKLEKNAVGEKTVLDDEKINENMEDKEENENEEEAPLLPKEQQSVDFAPKRVAM